MESNASSFSPGRLDKILYPYYIKDIENNILKYWKEGLFMTAETMVWNVNFETQEQADKFNSFNKLLSEDTSTLEAFR